MKKILVFIALFFLAAATKAQDIIPVTVQQYDNRIEVSMSYDRATRTNRPSMGGSDEVKYINQRVYITIRNKTQNHLVVTLTYYGIKTCGITSSGDINDAGGWGSLKGGQSKSTYIDVTYGNLGDKGCNPTKQGDGSYSYIRSVGYDLKSIQEEKPEPARPLPTNSTSSSSTSATSKPVTVTPSPSSSIPSSNSSTGNTSRTNTSTNSASTYEERKAALEAEELRKYNEQRQRIADKQKADEEFSKQLVQGTSELIGMIGNMREQNQKDREKKEAKKEAARIEKEEQKKRDEEWKKEYAVIWQNKINDLNKSLAYYLPLARQGNNDAVKSVMEIYDKKIELNVKDAIETKLAFLEEMYNNNKSVVATNFLKNYYSERAVAYKKEYKYHISRSISNIAVGGAFYSIRVFVPKKYDANGRPDRENNAVYRGMFGLGGAVYFGLTGIVHAFKIGKSKSIYSEANSKLKKLNSNSPKLTFLPNYDFQQGSLGLVIRAKF